MSNGDATSSEGKGSSPFPGCLILCAIIVVFGGLVVLYTVVGLYQNRTIDEFTQDEAADITLLEPTADQVDAAMAKLGAIRDAVTARKSERILLTPEDLNVLIATLEELKDFRGQTYIERISPQGLVAEMAQPMRKGIFDKGFRYLNATFILQPEVRARTVAFKVVDIRPVEGEVPKGFKENYATLDFFRLDPELEQIKAHVRSIATVYVEGGNLIVETKIPSEETTE